MKRDYVTYSLTDDIRNIVEIVCSDAGCPPADSSQDLLVSAMEVLARQTSEELPALVGTLQNLINEATSPGLVVLEGLPSVSDPRRVGLLIAWLLGDVTKYPGEGEHVIEIRDEGTKAGERPSFRNSREFFLHTDLSYVPEPPRFFLLHSIANDPHGGGYSEFCKIGDALDETSNLAIRQLEEPLFEFPAPPHYRGGGVVCFPVLWRTSEALPLRIRFRRDSLRTLTRPSIDAVVELIKSLKENSFEMSLRPNSIAIIDNWFLLHGRTAFAPQPSPRHINRIYINPRKGAAHGPDL